MLGIALSNLGLLLLLALLLVRWMLLNLPSSSSYEAVHEMTLPRLAVLLGGVGISMGFSGLIIIHSVLLSHQLKVLQEPNVAGINILVMGVNRFRSSLKLQKLPMIPMKITVDARNALLRVLPDLQSADADIDLPPL